MSEDDRSSSEHEVALTVWETEGGKQGEYMGDVTLGRVTDSLEEMGRQLLKWSLKIERLAARIDADGVDARPAHRRRIRESKAKYEVALKQYDARANAE